MCMLFAAGPSYAVGVPGLKIPDLVEASDVIVVAEVGAIKTAGARTILFQSRPLNGELYSADLVVTRVLKGSPPDRLTVQYVLPDSFVGYRGLQHRLRMVFLKVEQGGGYTLANPYYPDFPALVEGQSVSAADFGGTVVQEMLSVIASPSASPQEKFEILQVDYALPRNELAISAFKEGVATASDPDVKENLQSELIGAGDLSEVPDVVRLLATNSATEGQRARLLYVIGNRLSDRRALAALRPLLKSGEVSARRAAVEALWHIAAQESVPELASALEDSDAQVRFYSVRAFSDIAREASWGGPSESEFQANEPKYVAHWQEWAKSVGQ